MGFNAKLFEVVLYADSYDFDSLETGLKQRSGLRDYAYIIHDQCVGKNGALLKPHAHVMLRMSDTCNSDNVAKWFEAQPGQVERCKGRWADMLAYLTHANASEKFQYDPALVVSNFDWFQESQKAGRKNRDARLDEILEGIGSGEIRKFNLYDHLTIQEWSKYKNRLNAGFEYRMVKMKGVNRAMKSYYIYGGSGTGKTTYAKKLAEDLGYSIFISSGSNDVLDGYEGQDCIILDDLRPSCLGLSDLLKMLDPRTASTVKSRYYNKTLECKLIIITTTLEMESFFARVFENENEPLKQFERRCEKKIRLTKDTLDLWRYQPKSGRYQHVGTAPNLVLKSLGLRDLTKEELLAEAEEMFKSLGSFSESVKKNHSGQKPVSMVDAAADLFGAVPVSRGTVPF